LSLSIKARANPSREVGDTNDDLSEEGTPMMISPKRGTPMMISPKWGTPMMVSPIKQV
jgi:hypothetical protein